MTDTTISMPKIRTAPIWVRIVCGMVASGFSGWFLNFLSLHGVDFKVLGVDSEFVKSSIESTLTGIGTAPECIPLAIAGIIVSLRLACRTIRDAFTKPLPPDDK